MNAATRSIEESMGTGAVISLAALALVVWCSGSAIAQVTFDPRDLSGVWTIDEVVFGDPDDLVLLGARSLEGLNLTIDPIRKRLMDAGPAPTAVSAFPERGG